MTNGSANDTVALISGVEAGLVGYVQAVKNFGTISAGSSYGDYGVFLEGGSLTNGSSKDRAATISGVTGVVMDGGGSCVNFGTISGDSGYNGPPEHGKSGYGVVLNSGGDLTNGSASDTTALIGASKGVYLAEAGRVSNFGTIQGGIDLVAGGTVLNSGVIFGGPFDTTVGIFLYSAGRIVNNGDIYGGAGIIANYEGGTHPISIVNNQKANISGYYAGIYLGDNVRLSNYGSIFGAFTGVNVVGANDTVMNLGTITSQGGSGVQAYGNGIQIINGSATNKNALIQGGDYTLRLDDGASAVNFGTISGYSGSYAALLGSGDNLTNGAAGHVSALIDGVRVSSADTVINYGILQGLGGGDSVEFQSSGGTLVVEAGCTFIGAVHGDGSTLDLAGGVGRISGGLAAGALTVSGSMKPATFTAFGTLEIAAGGSFTGVGPFGVASAQIVKISGSLQLGSAGVNTVTNAGLIEVLSGGSLTVLGTLTNTSTIEVQGGTLTASRPVSGSGVAMIAGGMLAMGSSFTENVTFTGAGGELQLAKSLSYTGTVAGFSKSGASSFDFLDVGFENANEATFSGTKTGGVLSVTDGTHTAHIALTGYYLNTTFVAASDGNGGVTVAVGTAPLAAATGAFVAAMASMGMPAGTVTANGHALENGWRMTLSRPGLAAA